MTTLRTGVFQVKMSIVNMSEIVKERKKCQRMGFNISAIDNLHRSTCDLDGYFQGHMFKMLITQMR